MRPDYRTSWSMVPGMGGRVERSEELLSTIDALREVAEEYGIEDAFEQVSFDDGWTYTLDELEDLEERPEVIDEVEVSYRLPDDHCIELSYSQSIFDDTAYVNVWGNDRLREDVEEASGEIVYGTGTRRLMDIGRSLWRDVDEEGR